MSTPTTPTTTTAIPIQIAFRNLDRSMPLILAVHRSIARLRSRHRRITGIRVVLERRHGSSSLEACIELALPGARVVSRGAPPGLHYRHDALLAVSQAFARAERQLERHDRMRLRIRDELNAAL